MNSAKKNNVSKILISSERVKHQMKDGKPYYEENSFYIDRYGSKEQDQELYVCFIVRIKNQSVDYLGLINGDYKRHGKGLNIFEAKDVYIGDFENDKMEGEGILISKEKNNQFEIFKGEWREDRKVKGFNLWLCNEKGGFSVDWDRFDLFYGEYDDPYYKDGLFLSYEEKRGFYIYKGKFVYNTGLGKIVKQDDKSLFFSQKDNRIFEGMISADSLKKGKVFLLNPHNKEILRIYDCEYSEEEMNRNKISSYEVVENVDNGQKLTEFVKECEYSFQKELEKLKKFVSELLQLKNTNELNNLIPKIEYILKSCNLESFMKIYLMKINHEII